MPHYAAIVREDGSLELPVEARKFVQPGQLIDIELIPSTAETRPTPNYGMLAALDEIVKRQEGRPQTDGSPTDAIIREGRGGAMYG